MSDRIGEKDLGIAALRAAASRPGGVILVADLVDELEDLFDPKGEDAEILEGRVDSRFSQKVRNLISHRDTSTSIFSQGWAEYLKDEKSIRITDSGRAYLEGLDAQSRDAP